MHAFRIGDRRHPLMDGVGAFLCGGRWNSPGQRVVYAAATYSGALLEQLAHANIGVLPRSQVWIEIQIPDELLVERVAVAEISDWNADHMMDSRKRGDRWLQERQTVALIVPSAVTAGLETNVLLNPDHPEFRRVTALPPKPVQWDPRLVRKSDVSAL